MMSSTLRIMMTTGTDSLWFDTTNHDFAMRVHYEMPGLGPLMGIGLEEV